MTPVTVDLFPVAALAALFDDGLAAPGPGDPLPPYWHLAACAAPPPTGVLGPDGHSRTSPVPTPPEFPRRMFAGGRLRLTGAARLGERLERITRVTARTQKQGRSGLLRFVTVEHRLTRPDGTEVLTEEQDLVFRAAPGTPATATRAGTQASRARSGAGAGLAGTAGGFRAPGPLLTRHEGPMRAGFAADATSLQRFSAATSNPHRIHYDHPYVTGVEGYPGLVVHGPLVLVSLLELVRLDLPEREVSGVTFRARSPVFAGDQLTLAGELTSGSTGPGGIRLTASHTDGRVAMTCQASFGS